MELINIKDRAKFLPRFAPQILRMDPKFKVPLICMEPGQEIPPHPSSTGIFYIVSGSAIMSIAGKEVDVEAGNMIFVEAGEPRGIRAKEKMVAFAVHIS